MGPAIILDKSTLQALSVGADHELRSYFYLNVPPVLVAEVLGDLSKYPDDEDKCRSIVGNIARKASPPDAIVNAHYHSLCHSELLGNPEAIAMDRRPYVAGARSIVSTDGRRGTCVGIQPENEALCRWMRGEFGDADRKFAKRWRDSIKALDLEGFKKNLTTPKSRINTLDDLAVVIDGLLDSDHIQPVLLDNIMTEIRMDSTAQGWVRSRWRNHDYTRLCDFAPYSCHCTRVNMFLYLGISNGLIGTKNSNRIDVEYFYYAPFTFIFSSRDNVHRRLAPYLLDSDQSFVDGDTLLNELNMLAEAREGNSQAEPKPGSPIRSLWEKHWGKFHPQSQPHKKISDEHSKKTLKELQPILDAIQRDSEQQPPTPRWPA